MKIPAFLIFQLTISAACISQSYQIYHFQSTYDSLITYNSVNLEMGLAGEDPYIWEKSFDFGFEFPFYKDTFNNVYIDNNANGYFPGSNEYNLFLFEGLYITGLILDTPYLHSEVRYAYTTINNLDALVIEYHNVYVLPEYVDDREDHFINFQMWFYDNGVIEVHFGNIDLTNCTYYFPGQGFSFDNEDPTGNIYGPWVSINNNDFSESACFFGDHENPEILYDDFDNCSVLTSIPPEGFVIQFSPSTISAVEDFHKQVDHKFNVMEHNGIVEISGDLSDYKSCSMYDLMGRKVGYSEESEFSINAVHGQVYILLIESELGTETHKLFVK